MNSKITLENNPNDPHLLVWIFMSLQCFHDGELSVVLKAGRLVPQNLLQDTQGQCSDCVLRENKLLIYKISSTNKRYFSGLMSSRLCLPTSQAEAAALSWSVPPKPPGCPLGPPSAAPEGFPVALQDPALLPDSGRAPSTAPRLAPAARLGLLRDKDSYITKDSLKH